MLKKIVITLIALVLLAAAALAFFIATFDAERYRSLIETKAAELTGFPVKLGGISLTWKNGLALEVRDLALKVRETDPSPAPVSVRSAYVALEVMPLLRGTLQMGSIIVEGPEVRITRSPDGVLRGAAELTQVKPAVQTKNPSGAESTLALLIQNLSIRDGKFIFQDQYGGRVREFTADQIELQLSNVSLLNPFPVELKAALFSGRQNVTLAGKVHVRLTKQEVSLQDFVLESSLEDLDMERLSQAFPELRDAAVPALAGQVTASLSDMTFSDRADPVFNAQITLNQGRLAFPDMEAVENIALQSQADADGLKIESLSADWSGGRLASSAQLDWRKAPHLSGSFQTAISGVDLTQAVPAPASSRDPGISGILSADLRGSFTGAEAETLTRMLTGDGKVLIKQGVITNLNVLNEILNKLSIIPGAAQKIQERLSEEYLEKLKEKDTRLEDVNLPLRIQGGFIFMDPIGIRSDTFQIAGAAQGSFDGPVNGRLFAAIDPEFSLALMKSVRELEYIADQNGQITVPLTIRGTLQAPQVLPELQQLASRLAAAKAQELISGFLTKKNQGEAQTADTTAEPSAQQASAASPRQSAPQTDPFAALLGQVLQAASQKNNSTDDQ